MAKKLLTSYTFTPGASGVGTVVVPGTYTLEQFLLVTNVTSNVIIYEFDSAPLGGALSTGGGNTTLTLDYNTSSMSAGDRLQIFVDDATTGASVTVSNTGANPVPITATTLPLPTGAATESTLSTLSGKIPSSLTVTSTRLLVDGSGVTQPISAGSLPLPTGAATSAKQPALGIAGTPSTDVITVQGTASMTALKVDGSAVTQPVSGTISANLNAGTNAIGSITNTTFASTQSGTWTVQPGNTQNTTPWLIRPSDGTNSVAIKAASTAAASTDPALVVAVSPNNTVPISAATLPLPTGAATASKQPALGIAGTPSTDVITVQGIASGVAQPVSGTVTVNAGTNTSTASLALETGGNLASLNTKVPSNLTVKAASTAAAATDPALVVAVSPNNTIPVSGTFWQATQPVSGTVSANLNAGTNAIGSITNTSFASTQSGTWTVQPGNTANTTPWLIRPSDGTNSAAIKAASTAAVATDPALVVAVSPNNTVPISAASLPLPTGAATAAKQPALGTAGVASTDVITVQGIASGVAQPVSQSGTFTVAQGTAAAAPWLVRVNDGTNSAAIKAASTAAAATDPALVVAVSPNNTVPINIGQIAGSTAVGAPINGSANNAILVFPSSCVANTEYTAQNVAATSGSLAVISSLANAPAMTFDVNVTAFTAGTSTGLDIYLQESPDNGTTFYDIWQCEAFTAAGRARIPALPVNGRRRIRWVNRTGAATTATLTVTSMGTPAALPIQRQFFDRTSGVGSGTAVLNTSSAAYDIAGCKAFTVVMQAGTATAVASFQVQMSMDGTNWYNASAATAIGATTANNTVISITSGLTGRFIRVTCTAAGTSQTINAIHIYGTN